MKHVLAFMVGAIFAFFGGTFNKKNCPQLEIFGSTRQYTLDPCNLSIYDFTRDTTVNYTETKVYEKAVENLTMAQTSVWLNENSILCIKDSNAYLINYDDYTSTVLMHFDSKAEDWLECVEEYHWLNDYCHYDIFYLNDSQ